jgi:hypothetical protein
MVMSSKADISIQPRGWIVLLETRRFGGNRAVLVAYAAAFPDSAQAQQAVAEFVEEFEGDDLLEPCPLSDATVEALGLRPGEVRLL